MSTDNIIKIVIWKQSKFFKLPVNNRGKTGKSKETYLL